MNNIENTKHYNLEIHTFKADNGVDEHHLMIHASFPRQSYHEQLTEVQEAYQEGLRRLPGAVAVFKRFFLSDASNQTDYLMAQLVEESDCAYSIVEQAPLDGTKVALWVYLQSGVQTAVRPNGLYEVSHGSYRHLWKGYDFNRAANSEYQARLLLNDYVMKLNEEGCTLSANCIRTWFFVQNIDVNYAGVVKARNEVFFTQGLTPDTHFIASTGICGRHAEPGVCVEMDTYSIAGIRPEQVHHLYAPTHLNPTYEYGVSFERGTYVDYGDRRQVFISGTASINNRGEVVHPGDIRRQTQRMWENVEALLSEADCHWADVGHLIVYLRDPADYTLVREMFDERFPNLPKVIVHASVCRPGWLIEMECMAVKAMVHPEFPAY